jgi:prolyl-tRNA synthetase
MRVSNLFGKTLRELPSDADTVSHQLLLKAGMIHQIAAGVYAYLPLAWRAHRKIESIIREEMDAMDGQELLMPALQPQELWQKSGRDLVLGQVLLTLEDRKERKMVLAPTHEEVVTELARYNIQSYRDLPLRLYHIQTKFRDEPRPRGGLVRVREFAMKDMYTFDTDADTLDVSYKKGLVAYTNIFKRCGLDSMVVDADSGAIGGKDSHEFMVVADTGEDEIIYCSNCDYAANEEKAVSVKDDIDHEEPLSVEEVATPDAETIEEVASYLKIPESKTLKAVFYIADGDFIFVTIRGDLDVNEVKLKNALKCVDLRLASDDEVKAEGIVAGSASLIGLKGIKSVADDSITLGSNFVVGANKPEYHLKNANYPRDFAVDIITDVALACTGHGCTRCGSMLKSVNGIEVGHVFKLGTVYSEKTGAYYLDKAGEQKPLVMGCYGIGVGRLLAAAIEQNHDDKGIIWPVPIAPYHVYLCALNMDRSKEVVEAAESLYQSLADAGIEVLFDDRNESAGIKFNDADLLGMPVRLLISPKSLGNGGVEVKRRDEMESALVSVDNAVDKIRALLDK